jgi:hypothetical protein
MHHGVWWAVVLKAIYRFLTVHETYDMHTQRVLYAQGDLFYRSFATEHCNYFISILLPVCTTAMVVNATCKQSSTDYGCNSNTHYQYFLYYMGKLWFLNLIVTLSLKSLSLLLWTVYYKSDMESNRGSIQCTDHTLLLDLL